MGMYSVYNDGNKTFIYLDGELIESKSNQKTKIQTNMRIKRICPICLEWNEWHGFVFTIIGLELDFISRSFEGELLGMCTRHNNLVISIFYFTITIESPLT